MFGKAKDKPSENDRVPSPVKQLQRTPAAPAEEAVRSVEEICSISSGMAIVGKVTGKGTVRVSGRIEGDVQASTVLINDGGQVEGDIVAEELTVGGRVKGTIRAHRVKLNGSAVVEGDIFHRSLSVE